MMQRSKAYITFLEQMNTVGAQKLKGYSSNILEEIYEEERAEVEELIWDSFQNGDCDLAKFLPLLKMHDGLEAMKNKLKECIVPSDNSLELAVILYNHTNENQYIQVFDENIKLGNDDQRISALAKLLKCSPTDKVYEIFKATYIYDNNISVRSAAASGILYCRGLIKNPYDIKEMMSVMDILKRMNENDESKRKELIQEMENK